MNDFIKAFRTSLFIAWGILGLVLFVPLVGPFLLTVSKIYSITPVCVTRQMYNEPCILCGMTRGFIEISRGNFGKAKEFNPYSMWLYSTLMANEMILVIVIGCKIAKTINAR